MLHQVISTTVLTRLGPEPESSASKRKRLHAPVFFCHRMCSQDRALEPASGFYKSELSECLPAKQINTPQSFWNWLYSYQRQTQPSTVTPRRAERYELYLALWLPESTCNRGRQGWAAKHLPRCQGVWPALENKCFSSKEKGLVLKGVQESETKLLAVNRTMGVVCVGVIRVLWETLGSRRFVSYLTCHLGSVGHKNLVPTSFYKSLYSLFVSCSFLWVMTSVTWFRGASNPWSLDRFWDQAQWCPVWTLACWTFPLSTRPD